MGLMVDTNVFIKFEKLGRQIDLSNWEPSGEIYISVVVASELLIGVHRADTVARRESRSAFAEAILSRVPILEFTLSDARMHAEIYAELARRGTMIGAHDLVIAATARNHNLPLLTDNIREFAQVPGLNLIPFST